MRLRRYVQRARTLQGVLRDSVRQEEGGRRHDLLDLGRASYTFGGPRIIAYGGDPDHRVTVGAFCSIAENVTFLIGGGHHTEWLSTYPFDAAFGRGHPVSDGPITVGNDVWIGLESLIMSGVTIGDGAVIGARSVITRDVEPYTIVVGSPARAVRTRFPPEEVAILRRLRWWDWPLPDIKDAATILTDGQIRELERFAKDRGLPA